MITPEIRRALWSEQDSKNTLKPFLIKQGYYSDEYINSLLPRIQWHSNFKTFTVKIEDQHPGHVPLIEQAIRRIQDGSKENYDIIHAFLSHRSGEILSWGIIDTQSLSVISNQAKSRFNEREGILFRYIPFHEAKTFCKEHKTGICQYWTKENGLH